MINNLKYTKISDDLVAIPKENKTNCYILKNKAEGINSVIIGKIKWKEDKFYCAFKDYMEIEAEYLKKIAEYMDGLQYQEPPAGEDQNDADEEEEIGNSLLQNLSLALSSMGKDQLENVEIPPIPEEFLTSFQQEGEPTNEENN